MAVNVSCEVAVGWMGNILFYFFKLASTPLPHNISIIMIIFDSFSSWFTWRDVFMKQMAYLTVRFDCK